MFESLTPIQHLLDDPAVSEILIDGWQRVYVEKEGQLQDSISPFRNEAELYKMVHAIAGQMGLTLDENRPILSCRLPDATRVDIAIPPVSLIGPAVTVRKFFPAPLQLADLLNYECLTQKAADFLRSCVEGRLNIAVSGGTGSGKTTLLRIMVENWVPADERLLVLQEANEFKLPHSRVVTLETCPPNPQGQGQVTLRDLVQSAVRMRPDRLIVTEVRGGELFDLVTIMNNGHDGTLFTLHSSGPRDSLARMEAMCSIGSPEVPILALRERIASAINLIVHQERMRDGTRKIVNISEVTGMAEGVIVIQDIFTFRETGLVNLRVQGKLNASGIIPTFLPLLQYAGINLPVSMFTPD